MVGSGDRNSAVGDDICLSAGMAIARFFEASALDACDRPSP